jgi:hypothetical protein
MKKLFSESNQYQGTILKKMFLNDDKKIKLGIKNTRPSDVKLVLNGKLFDPRIKTTFLS